MQSIKIIIFDLDGTLLNTDELYFRLLKRELRKYKISLNEKQYGQCGLDDAVFHVGLDEITANEIRERVHKAYYNDKIMKAVRFKKGAYKIIRELSKYYQLGIGSGEKIEQIERYLNCKNLRKYFKFIGHGGLVPQRKSNPQYFYSIARFFNVKPQECLMVGDSGYDANAAWAGFKVVIIPSKFTRHCVFGKECRILNNLTELLHLLKTEKVISL
jgi:pyrophosphatase PpaX